MGPDKSGNYERGWGQAPKGEIPNNIEIQKSKVKNQNDNSKRKT